MLGFVFFFFPQWLCNFRLVVEVLKRIKNGYVKRSYEAGDKSKEKTLEMQPK